MSDESEIEKIQPEVLEYVRKLGPPGVRVIFPDGECAEISGDDTGNPEDVWAFRWPDKKYVKPDEGWQRALTKMVGVGPSTRRIRK